MKLSYDLHIHSCLSPCGDDDMTPANIVGMASLKALDVIALTDHNSSLNCPAFLKHAADYGITAIPGMELCTSEEVHVLCLFETLKAALSFSDFVHSRFLPVRNKPEIFGKQQIMDESDTCCGTEPLLLINSAQISFDEVYALTEAYGGVMIPAHIDRSSNSLLSNLGFVPPDSRFTCFELKNPAEYEQLVQNNPYLAGCRMISDSDAHYLWDIHEAVNFIEAEDRSARAVLEALKRI